MNTESYPSLLLERAVEEFAKLPGIGRKTALRLVLYLLKQDKSMVEGFGQAMLKLRAEVSYCQSCNNIADTTLCAICANPNRMDSIVCVVESVKDVMAVENTQQFIGKYHVLGGIISPMEGVGPHDLTIDHLIEKVAKGGVNEVILALSTTMEGDTTNFYLFKKLKEYGVKVTTIARGISIGDELEYADELTLGRSIKFRTSYEDSLSL